MERDRRHAGVRGTSRALHPILRDEVYRLAAEALRNAFRHAAAHSVEVELHYDQRIFRIRDRVGDSGSESLREIDTAILALR
jgi:signal transduction histidine kinase